MLHSSVNAEAPAVRTIGPVEVAVIDESGAIAEIVEAIEQAQPQVFGFCNAHTVNVARKSAAFAEALSRMTLFNDGIGLDLASRLLFSAPFPANLNGTDLTPRVLASLNKPTNLFLLGSPPGIAARAGAVFAAAYQNVRITGTHDGFFDEAASAAIVRQIRASHADLLLVAMGHPRQEIWAVRNAEQIGVPSLCVGALLDFVAGEIPRAPGLIRSMRMEWAYRLALEPRRMAARYLVGNLTFLGAALRQRFGRQ